MAKSKRLALVAAACALAAAGCTTKADGQPTGVSGASDTSPPTTSAESSDSASPTVEIPPRPEDISLEGLDPCTLYTDAQRAQLAVDDVKSLESESEHFEGMKECSLDVQTKQPFLEYTALAVTTEGLEVWLTGKRNADAELTSIQGFPAAKFKFRGVEDEGCDIAIGVADNQYLWVGLVPTEGNMKQDQICQLTEQAADMAMTTLQTLK